MSGFNFFNLVPVINQLKGLIELITLWMVRPAGAGSDEYCVLPGNRNEGYCNENE
jgi:hypothetical protein